MIPEDLFVLVKDGVISHEEFVMLAVFHKETDYKQRGNIVLSRPIMAARTGLSVRTLERRLRHLSNDLHFITGRSSDVKGTKGFAVMEYIVEWREIHKRAAPLRAAARSAVPSARRSTGSPANRRGWASCPVCRKAISPYERFPDDLAPITRRRAENRPLGPQLPAEDSSGDTPVDWETIGTAPF